MNKLNIITPNEYYYNWYFRTIHPETGKRNYIEKMIYIQTNLPKKIRSVDIRHITYTLEEAFDREFKAYQIFSNILMTTKSFPSTRSNVNMMLEIDWVWALRNE